MCISKQIPYLGVEKDIKINSVSHQWSSWFWFNSCCCFFRRHFDIHVYWHVRLVVLFFVRFPFQSIFFKTLAYAWEESIGTNEKNGCNFVVYDDNICGKRIAMNKLTCTFCWCAMMETFNVSICIWFIFHLHVFRS